MSAKTPVAPIPAVPAKPNTPGAAQPSTAARPDAPAQNIPFHVHLARIRELERAQKGLTPRQLTPVMPQTPVRPRNDETRRAGQEQFVALRRRAVELETAKLFEQALSVYLQLLNSVEDCPEDLEIALLNRVGDLMTRVGRAAQAGDYYEMAGDKYASRGLADNAIAVYNKILRAGPNRNQIYLKLGRLSAKKGLIADAKRNYVEYAARVKLARNYDEAFRSLSEFVNHFPDQDDVRLALIEQLHQAGYQDEMVRQLDALVKYYRSVGRSADADRIAARLEATVPRFAG